MPIELKSANRFLQEQVRPLLRKFEQVGIDGHILFNGLWSQTLSLTLSHSGPILDLSRSNLRIIAYRDQRIVELLQEIELQGELDQAQCLKEIEELFDIQSALPEHPDQHQFEITPLPHALVDEKLILCDIEEFLSFFKSRFLVDAPKKMLYRGELTRGCLIQGYMGTGSHRGLQSASRSFFSNNISLRTQHGYLELQHDGQSLRSMRLSNIRRILAPFYQSTRLDQAFLPENLLLGSQALYRLALTALNQGDTLPHDGSLWNWLEPVKKSPVATETLSCLNIEGGAEHPLGQRLHRLLDRYKFPEGAQTEPLDDLLIQAGAGRDTYFYVHDLCALNIHSGKIFALSYGTLLAINRNQQRGFVHGYLRLTLDGETLTSQRRNASQRLKVFKNEQAFVAVPEFMFLDGIKFEHFAISDPSLEVFESTKSS